MIDGLNMEVRKHHILRLREGKCTIELGFVLADISTDFEQVADHCSNIAVCLLQQL
jgi:phosphate:Na+ symporter